MIKKIKKKTIKMTIFVIAILISVVQFYSDSNIIDTTQSNTEALQEQVDSTVKVYFLDVGQADSILIQNNNKNMLIDAGNNSDGEYLAHFFQTLGITKFDYMIGTHPHEDHIGGMDNIIQNFEIENVYMPDVLTTTATFEDVLDSLLEKNLTVHSPEIGDEFAMEDCKFTVMSIGTNEKNLNECSIVLKMQFGNKSFLFTGDATSNNEQKMLGLDISADVLKVAHHGSEYSTSGEFLEKVNPQFAVISVGKNNQYGHPTEETLQKLRNKNIEIYRTDKDKTILMSCDGEKIEVQKIETKTDGGK